MIAIIVLSGVLYSRCLNLLHTLRRHRMRLHRMRAAIAGRPDCARRLQHEVRESCRQQRGGRAAKIAAAPLLGLLGTVSGMVTTFDSLAMGAGQESMEGLARGISEVLVATESGLLVAIPALLFVYAGHRAVQRHVTLLNDIAPTAEGATSP
jgi:biopolymer transport protein ExbB/TolQ